MSGNIEEKGDAFTARYHYATVGGVRIFYREAGPKTAPTIIRLHDFPTSSHMFRNLIRPFGPPPCGSSRLSGLRIL
jgi:pimeloyl-ACP methyl ester carboxylesterase